MTQHGKEKNQAQGYSRENPEKRWEVNRRQAKSREFGRKLNINASACNKISKGAIKAPCIQP